MIGIRRLAAVAAVSSIVLAFTAASPAGAASAPGAPEVFQGTASATALDLALNGQTVTLGQGVANLSSQPLVSAAGNAILSVLGATKSDAKLVAPGALTDGPRCNPKIPLVIAEIDNACTTASVSLASGLGSALTHDTVDAVNLNLNSVLSSVPLNDVLTQTLQPVVNALGLQTQLKPVTDTVGEVLQNVLKTQTASLTIGDSNSSVVSTNGAVVSSASANGVTLKVLPLGATLGNAIQPLATITVGKSLATASYDRQTGKAVSSFDPALATIDVAATPLTPALHIPVTVGQTQTITLPAGLGSVFIQVADGSTFTRPDGTVGATANAVKLAVQLLNQPLINLAIAGAEATVAGAPAVPASLTPSPAKISPQILPHTGGYPWMPLAGGFVLVGFLVTRRMMAAGAR